MRGFWNIVLIVLSSWRGSLSSTPVVIFAPSPLLCGEAVERLGSRVETVESDPG